MFNKDTCTRTERYCPWDRADKRAKIHTKKGRTSRKEVEVETVDSTNSETDIQDGEGFSYAPKIYTNPEFAVTIPLSESEDNQVELTNKHFIGEYCSECVKKYNRCWCYRSDWEDELIEVEMPNIQRKLNVTVVPIRQPPPGWVEYRRHITKWYTNESESLREENPIEKLIIKGIKSISHKNLKKYSLKFISREILMELRFIIYACSVSP